MEMDKSKVIDFVLKRMTPEDAKNVQNLATSLDQNKKPTRELVEEIFGPLFEHTTLKKLSRIARKKVPNNNLNALNREKYTFINAAYYFIRELIKKGYAPVIAWTITFMWVLSVLGKAMFMQTWDKTYLEEELYLMEHFTLTAILKYSLFSFVNLGFVYIFLILPGAESKTIMLIKNIVFLFFILVYSVHAVDTSAGS
jgi:hypothetical protein